MTNRHPMKLGDFLPASASPQSFAPTWARYFIIPNASQPDEWRSQGNFKRTKYLNYALKEAGANTKEVRWFHRANKDVYIIASTERASEILTKYKFKAVQIQEHPYDNCNIGFVFHHDFMDEKCNEVQEAVSQELENYDGIKIKDVYAFGKRNDKTSCSGRIKISFKNHQLPEKLQFWGQWLYIEQPRIQIRHCTKCFRFGHTTEKCRTENQLCSRCYNHHSQAASCELKRCINCGGEHEATSKECNAMEKEEIIHNTAIGDGISFAHARILVQERLKGSKSTSQVKNVYPTQTQTNSNEDIKTMTSIMQNMISQQAKIMETLNVILVQLNLDVHVQQQQHETEESEQIYETPPEHIGQEVGIATESSKPTKRTAKKLLDSPPLNTKKLCPEPQHTTDDIRRKIMQTIKHSKLTNHQ